METSTELDLSALTMLTSLDPATVNDARETIKLIGKEVTAYRLLLTLAANLSHLLSVEEWLAINGLLAAYRRDEF